MSDLQARQVTLAAMTLQKRLEAVGIPVPDQEMVKTLMEAARRGLSLPAPASQMELGLFAKAVMRFLPAIFFSQQWCTYTEAAYAAVPRHCMGAPMPLSVAKTAHRALTRIPGAQMRIHALPTDDPWVEVVLGDESIFIKGWIRSGSAVTIII